MALIQITDYTLHTDLESTDKCYYLRDYIQGKGFQGGQTNTLIINLKKEVKYKGTPQYYYKERAISQVAREFASVLAGVENFEKFIFCPIPPSKERSHPEYDDRMTQVLSLVGRSAGVKVQELIKNVSSHEANHNSTSGRLSYSELKGKFEFDDSKHLSKIKGVVLVDDVITNGRHFKVCKNLILERFPEAEVFGLFVARRVTDEPKWSPDDFLFEF